MLDNETNLLINKLQAKSWEEAYFLWSHKLPWEHVIESDGKNVLAYMASIGDLDACKFLIGKGACPYATDYNNLNAIDVAKTPEIKKAVNPEPLIEAITIGDVKKVQSFLEEMPYMINVYTKGNVPLCNFAISHRAPIELLQVLLKFSPDLYLPDENFVTAMDVATNIQYKEAMELLKEKGMKFYII